MNQVKKIIIGSRGSKLALLQSNLLKKELQSAQPDLQIEIKIIETAGDKILDQALSKIGDKGLFVKELETELLNKTIDMAVHSMKDLPSVLPEGLEIAYNSQREDLRDVLCLSQKAQAAGINSIKDAKVIGTSSLRRVSQLKRLYPNIEFKDIRGNLDTRFKKLEAEDSDFDGIILAAAGIKRLAQEDSSYMERISEYLDPLEVLPAVAQGILAVEIASKRTDIKDLLSQINSSNDEMVAKAERSFLRTLEGGCQVPIGIYSQLDSTKLSLTGMVASLDGTDYIRDEIVGELADAEQLGVDLAQKLISQGAASILNSLGK